MEGPFFAESREGAQIAAHLRLLDYNAFKELINSCEGLIKIVDVAPELDGAPEFIEKAKELCTISVAHTDCSYDDAKEAFDRGARQLAHLYNAMPSLHHRNPRSYCCWRRKKRRQGRAHLRRATRASGNGEACFQRVRSRAYLPHL